jgi:hypothetical protein
VTDDLNPAARGLVASARRSGRTLEPGRKVRLKYAVAASVAASSAALSVVKLVVVGALSAALGAGTTLLVVKTVNSKPARPALPLPRSVPSAAAPLARPLPPEPRPAEPPTVERPPAIRPAPGSGAVLPVVPSAPAPAPEPATPELATAPLRGNPPPPATSALVAELELLREVLLATQAQRWADAQRALDDHARRFVPAALRSEAHALQVVVWCGTGRVEEARGLARELEKADPLNPAVQRLRGTCAE